MKTRTLTRMSRPVRWVDADGVRRELRPGDAIPEEALSACPEGRLEAHRGGGEDGGRVLGVAAAPPDPSPLPVEPAAGGLGASLTGFSAFGGPPGADQEGDG